VDEQASVRRSRRRPPVAALVTLVIGLIITATTALVIRNAAHHDAEEQFRQSANQTAVAVEREVSRYFEELNSVGAFVASSRAATPEEFRNFVDEAHTFRRLPSMAGVFFLQRVEAADLDAFIEKEQARNPGFAYFPIGEAAPGATHYILTYYMPNDVDLALPVGTDVTPITSLTAMMGDSGSRGVGIASSFQQDPLLQRIAQDTRFPLITSLLNLDFFIGEPVYGATADDAQPRVPIGWVGAPIDHFDQVINAARTGQPDDIGVRVTVDLNDTTVGQRDDLSRVAEQPGRAGSQADAAFTSSRSTTVDGVTFRLDAWSTADADDVPNTVPVVLIVGLASSLLAAGVVGERRRARDRERAFAGELADRAQFQRDIVDSVTNPMVVLDAGGLVTATNEAWGRLRERSHGPDAPPLDRGRPYLEILAPDLRSGREELADELEQVLGGATDVVEVDIPLDQQGRRRWYSCAPRPCSAGAAVRSSCTPTSPSASAARRAGAQGQPRSPHRVAQPGRPRGRDRHALVRARANNTMVRRCSSTSTGSRPSTTPTATPWATTCCDRWPGPWRPRPHRGPGGTTGRGRVRGAHRVDRLGRHRGAHRRAHPRAARRAAGHRGVAPAAGREHRRGRGGLTAAGFERTALERADEAMSRPSRPVDRTRLAR
jgi:PAS domain-containing protein